MKGGVAWPIKLLVWRDHALDATIADEDLPQLLTRQGELMGALADVVRAFPDLPRFKVVRTLTFIALEINSEGPDDLPG